MTADRLLALTMAALMVTAGLAVATPVAADGDAINVQTAGATDVTASDATLQGNLTHLNDTVANADVAVAYWEAGDPANNTTVDAGELTGTGEFSAHATGLDNGTTYAYQATAEANGTTVEGSVVEFTTADREIALDVATEPPTNVTDTAATLVGNLTELDEAATNTTVSFQYWVEGDRSTKEKVEQSPDGTGVYTAAVENLTAGETYVVRAHAETGASDVNYTADDRGAELTFTTGTGEFGVSTGDASDVTNSSATLNGELTGLNGSEDAAVGFEYYPEGDAANASSVDAGQRSSVGAFDAEVTGLDNNTTYVYTATATADNATVVGENVTFTPGVSDDGPTYEGEQPFGQWLVGVLGGLDDDGDDSDDPFGQIVSAIVTANNPGNGDGPPEHAGPPEDAGPDRDDANETEDDDRRGPPEHAGPPEDAGPDRDDANETDDGNETEDDDRRGPPEDAGPPEDVGPDRDDANETDDGNETEDDDRRGPPEDAGPPADAGPPEDVGPDRDDANETDDGNETEDDDRRGPPEHAGPPEDAGPDRDDESEEDESDEEDEAEDEEEDESDEEEEAEDEEEDESDEEDEAEDEEDESEDDGDAEDDDDDERGGGPPADSPGNGNGGGPP